MIAGNIFYFPCHGVVKREKVKTSHYPHMSNTDPESLKMQMMKLFPMNAHSVIFKIKPIFCYESANREKAFFFFFFGFVKLNLQGRFSYR